MENSAVSSPMPPRDKNSTLTLVLIGVIIILCLGFIVVVIGYIGLTTGTNKPANSTNTTNSLVAIDPVLKITSPEVSSVVNGKINVKGTATYHFSNLKVELFDSNNKKLASTSVSINSASDSTNNWEAQLDVIESPATDKGRIVVTSAEPAKEESVNILFESYSDSPSTLIIYTPLKDQVMFSNDLHIRGEAKGLFEGVLQIRLKDEQGNEIYNDSVTIPDQLTEFRKFDYNINIDKLSQAKGKTGTWDFYYSSAKDGSEVLLQSIQVKFL